MHQPISRRQHALADYTYIPLVAAAPSLLGFRDEQAAQRVCWAASGAAALSTLFTRAEWGLVRVLPFQAHLALDATLGVMTLGAPWLFGFARNRTARTTLLAMGAVSLAVVLLSRPTEMPPA